MKKLIKFLIWPFFRVELVEFPHNQGYGIRRFVFPFGFDYADLDSMDKGISGWSRVSDQSAVPLFCRRSTDGQVRLISIRYPGLKKTIKRENEITVVQSLFP